ncbi:MAG: hypothetical protein M1143_00720 [Candidatus Thermoplasmatota archaeon]|jgi:hypothetical protein|nr:hypothetical protein [Candidatus Thermoplasmatota archaeon]
MKLKPRSAGKPTSKPLQVKARKLPSPEVLAPPKRPAQVPLVLTDASGQKISISVGPDGSTKITRSGPPPPPSTERNRNTMVLQGRFGKIAIGVDTEGRIHVGRQVRPLELLRKQARRKSAVETPQGNTDTREPWDESE